MLNNTAQQQVSAIPPFPLTWVIEMIWEGQRSWLIEPIPLEFWTWTTRLNEAHGFELRHEAETIRSSIWCGFDSKRIYPVLTVRALTDDYRAEAASVANSCNPLEIANDNES